MAASASPTGPRVITGGCNCESVRYTVTFPPDHDFRSSCSTCQCTQCRKSTGTLALHAFTVPLSSVDFSPSIDFSSTTTTSSSSTSPASNDAPLRLYHASPAASRGFCSRCGSFLLWKDRSRPTIHLTVGSVDQEHLAGHGALLATPGVNLWCEREVRGVSDWRGERWRLDCEPEGVAQKMEDST